MIGILLSLISLNASALIHKKETLFSNRKSILVAVIDTGADISHMDLRDTVWINPGETGFDSKGRDRRVNGVDDDGNGYIDDVHGWNFVDNTNKVYDYEGHGTHVAGIIKSQFYKRVNKKDSRFLADNSSPLQMMIIKYYSSKLSDLVNMQNTVKALNYATKMQARIINYSAGGAQANEEELLAIRRAESRGIIMVTAAGNERSNEDFNHYYPASYGLENIVAVAALSEQGTLASFSNYGKKRINMAAPGELIYSTLPNNKYGLLSGTSQSTAYVSGVLAYLLYKLDNGISYRTAIAKLNSLAVTNKNLKGRTKNQLALVSR